MSFAGHQGDSADGRVYPWTFCAWRTVEEILKEYEGLNQEDIQACFPFAAQSLENTSFMPLTAKTRSTSSPLADHGCRKGVSRFGSPP